MTAEVGALARKLLAGTTRLLGFGDAESRKGRALVDELRKGIADNQLFLLYQPQVEIGTGRVIGVEALVRWRHPTRGILSPNLFIPAAEESGLIVALGRWVLHEACRQAGEWLSAEIAPDVVSVNLSAVQLRHAHDLEREIEAAMGEAGLPRGMLEVELTESALMENSRRNHDFLSELRRLGVRLAIDDFGTGYSSLLYLRRFPVDRIKIAQDFVFGLENSASDAAIVKATIGLARELGMSVIAEGVETMRQLQLLGQWGCREAQGYYYARPLSAADATALLRSGEPLPRCLPAYAEAV